MDLNNKKILSSIIQDENTGLYSINIPGIKRQFQAIYYSNGGENKGFGTLYKTFEQIDLKHYIVAISIFKNTYIICFINLKDLSSKYYFTSGYEVLNIKIKNKDYFLFTYLDSNNKNSFISDLDDQDYSINISENNLHIKHNIFESVIFSKHLIFSNKLHKTKTSIRKKQDKKYLNIADFYIYDDIFIQSPTTNFDDIYKLLSAYNDKIFSKISNNNIKIQTHYFNNTNQLSPKLKISILTNGETFDTKYLDEIRTLLLSFFCENIISYIILNKDIQNYFSKYFYDFSKVNFTKINYDFTIPDNIYTYDEAFKNTKKQILKLSHNLYTLKKLSSSKTTGNNENAHIEFANKRQELNKQNIDTFIPKYEKKLMSLLTIIINKKLKN